MTRAGGLLLRPSVSGDLGPSPSWLDIVGSPTTFTKCQRETHDVQSTEAMAGGVTTKHKSEQELSLQSCATTEPNMSLDNVSCAQRHSQNDTPPVRAIPQLCFVTA